MAWVQNLDVGLFRFINGTLSNPVFDRVMPFVSGNMFFIPLLVLAAGWLVWRYRLRGVLCVVMLALIVWPGDTFICNTIKHKVARLRPYVVLPDAHKRARATAENSMPSSHAANWGAGTMILFIYFRRSWRFMLPMALLVAFSRIYNGVHYPSDVLAGLVLGGGYAAAGVWTFNKFWQWVGKISFPQWQKEHLPSLVILKTA
jgi:membrane-associated phospholipid phosphatase